VLWDVLYFRTWHQRLERNLLPPEGSRFLGNYGTHVPNYIASNPGIMTLVAVGTWSTVIKMMVSYS
jgi:hypothetical protein